MSDCLPCDINQLVREHVERGTNDLVEIASVMAESLVDVVLMSQEDCANLLAHAISAVGQIVLEKSGAFEGTSSAAPWRFVPLALNEVYP